MNRPLPLVLSWCLCLAIALSGCTTISQKDNAAVTADIRNMEREIVEINGRIEEIQVEQRQLRADIQKKGEMSVQETASLQSRLAELERRIRDVDTARESDRQKIVEQLSEKISKIVNKYRAPASSASESGNEHVVQPGETLTGIAKQYGVKVDAIVNANQLKDVNSLRAGQKLFIPQ